MLNQKTNKLAEEAKRQGKWLYDPTDKKWYSPEDLIYRFTHADVHDEFLNQLQIKHPKEAIDVGFKRLTDLQMKLQAFVTCVNDYYDRATT